MKKKKLTVSFTGSRRLVAANEKIVKEKLIEVCKRATRIITGACIGIDSFIARFVAEEYPDIMNIVIVPADQSRVCPEVLALERAFFMYMPNGTTYKDRNAKLVELADEVYGFWTGDKRYSGTWQTINLARKAKKFVEPPVMLC